MRINSIVLCAKIILIGCAVIPANITGYCQSDQRSFTLSLKSGLIRQTTIDHLLNYYNYSGKTAPLVLDGFYFSKQHLFVFNLLYQSATLYPDNVNDTYYEYNYVLHKEGEVKLEYFFTITKKDRPFSAYVGISNTSFFVTQQENYKNLLSSNGEGYRESYALSPLNLSPSVMMNVRMKSHNIMIKAAYALLNYTGRPDDNFVKQLDWPTTHQWNWYGPSEYKNIFLSGIYAYRIFRKAGITADYNFLYRRYNSTADYRYLRHSFLLGFYKTF